MAPGGSDMEVISENEFSPTLKRNPKRGTKSFNPVAGLELK
jgi:hypothetical protein